MRRSEREDLAGPLFRVEGGAANGGPPDGRPPVFAHGQPQASLDGAAIDLEALLAELPKPPADGFRPESATDFTRAYREGRTTPLEIAERAVAIIRESDERDPPMRVLIAHHRDDLMEQAVVRTWTACNRR